MCLLLNLHGPDEMLLCKDAFGAAFSTRNCRRDRKPARQFSPSVPCILAVIKIKNEDLSSHTKLSNLDSSKT